MERYFIYIMFLSMVSVAVPLYTGRHKRHHVLWIYCLISLLADVLTTLLKRVYNLPQAYMVGNIFMCLEAVAFVYYFYKMKIISHKNLTIMLTTSMIAFAILHNYFVFQFQKFDSQALAIMLLIYVILALFGYIRILHDQKSVYISQVPFFWGNTAIFIYASCSFFIFLMKEQIEVDRIHTYKYIWTFGFYIICITKNLLIAQALKTKKAN